MWRNEVVLNFIQWLRTYNSGQPTEKKVGFYGLDLYSLFESAHEVIQYLEKIDPEAAKTAKERYGCFDRFHSDTTTYGYAAAFGFSASCQAQVVKQLIDMQKRYAEEFEKKSFHTSEDGIFYAKENALVVKDAEEYYRCMFTENTWNLRDKHMVQTLQDLLEHLSKCFPFVQQKAVIWAHNSHLGDAGATDSSRRGETNIGQLVRKEFGLKNTFNVGFTTYTGTVTCASNWDEPATKKKVNPAMSNSYENLFHTVEIPKFCLVLRTNEQAVLVDTDLVKELKNKRLERAIGVIYRPDTERQSHYFYACLPEQFDAIIHIDKTTALKPLDKREEIEVEPDTFPFGV